MIINIRQLVSLIQSSKTATYIEFQLCNNSIIEFMCNQYGCSYRYCGKIFTSKYLKPIQKLYRANRPNIKGVICRSINEGETL